MRDGDRRPLCAEGTTYAIIPDLVTVGWFIVDISDDGREVLAGPIAFWKDAHDHALALWRVRERGKERRA